MIRDYSVGAFMGESGGGSRSGVRRRRRGRWGRFAPSAPTLLALLALGAWATFAAAPLVAQVGYRPESSPYRDIPKHHAITAIFGQYGGDGGRFGIAPHDGQLYGLRYDIRTGSPVQFGLGVLHGTLTRLIVDPFVELVNRVSGPVDQSVTFGEVNLQFNVTGGKRWNRLAPFIGTGVGLTFPSATPEDTSGFEVGHKVYLAPYGGVRVFVTDRLSLRAEARAVFLKLTYPPTFEQEPPLEPGNPPLNSNAVIKDGNVSEWTTSSLFSVGLAFSFHL